MILQRKRPVGKPRHTLKGNIKMDLQEVACRGMDCLQLAVGMETGGRQL